MKVIKVTQWNGEKKIPLIKTLRELTGTGLKESKRLADMMPTPRYPGGEPVEIELVSPYSDNIPRAIQELEEHDCVVERRNAKKRKSLKIEELTGSMDEKLRIAKASKAPKWFIKFIEKGGLS